MVTLPTEFIAVYIPGYYWNYDQQWLYSLKSGLLRRIAKCLWKGEGKMDKDGWRVSHLGVRRHLYTEDLIKLRHFDAVVDVDHSVRVNKVVKPNYRPAVYKPVASKTVPLYYR